ncbi:hypothetical protein MKX01_019858 [Papaver californicum]|nr:hypothetical protein MKX01_019858 [Papaver californicum]
MDHLQGGICLNNCTPWIEEEHRQFLLGLRKLGKRDWRGIARNYVVSRTPTQFDTPAVPKEEPFFIESEMGEIDNVKSVPSLNLSLEHDCEHMETTCNKTSPSVEAIEEGTPNLGSPSTEEENYGRETTISNHRVLKPTPFIQFPLKFCGS